MFPQTLWILSIIKFLHCAVFIVLPMKKINFDYVNQIRDFLKSDEFNFFCHWSGDLNIALGYTSRSKKLAYAQAQKYIWGQWLNCWSMKPIPRWFTSLASSQARAFSCCWQKNTENVLEERAKFSPGQHHVVWLSAEFCIANTVREVSYSSMSP